MIVWGHNNFLLKTVQPSDLGIFDKSYNGITFELRQKYGHLFWIPFIPIGKIWVMRKGDKHMYQCPNNIERTLEQQFNARTSVWAWSGPLLLIGGFILFGISSTIEQAQREKRNKESFSKTNDKTASKLDSLVIGNYIMLNVKVNNKENNYYDNNKIPLKVLGVLGDSISLGVIYSPYAKEKASALNNGKKKNNIVIGDIISENETKMEIREEAIRDVPNNYNNRREESYESINEEYDVARFETKFGIIDSFKMAIKDLKKGVNNDYGNENNFDGIKIKPIALNGFCMVKEIWYVNGPILKEVNLDGVKRDGRYFELENKGFDAQADSIVSMDKAVEWQLSKKRSLKYGEVIAIKTNGKSRAMLYCSDNNKKVYKSFIDNTDYRLMIGQETK